MGLYGKHNRSCMTRAKQLADSEVCACIGGPRLNWERGVSDCQRVELTQPHRLVDELT